MSVLAIDLEQFVRDPYGTGIQRVLQGMARHWPNDVLQAQFVIPWGDQLALLDSQQATALLDLPFQDHPDDVDLRFVIRDHLVDLQPIRVDLGRLLALVDGWFLPEVSYLDQVLDRAELAARCLPTGMIGNDALPQTHPANYRFAPGNSGRVSRYFRMLASVETLVCISEESRQDMWQRLRRDRALTTTVSLPGGDHLPVRASRATTPPTFLRLGTLEGRKRPREILAGFRAAVAAGSSAQLIFLGKESKSDLAINADVEQAMAAGLPVRWIRHASDAGIADLMNQASVFLSFGVEGYGIPVLESIRQGTPVLYSGIQPAAEVMRGRGARPVVADTIDEMAAMFQEFASPGALADLRAEVDPHAVPTWRQFSHDIASAMLQAIRRN